MRRAFAAIILLCIVYFLGGWIAVYFEWILKDTYFSYAGIVGGLASVVGLLSFTRPALSNADLQQLELGSLKSITETSEKLQELEKKRAETEGQLETLDLQKQEMELLVRKASLALFLKERYLHHERLIIERIEINSDLKESLDEVRDISQKISALNEEIDADPNVAVLKDIMAAASTREPTLSEAIQSLPPVARSLVLILRELSRSFESALNTLLR